MWKRIAGFAAVVAGISLLVQPALAQRVITPAPGQDGIHLVHKAPAKKAAKSTKQTQKKAKPAARQAADKRTPSS